MRHHSNIRKFGRTTDARRAFLRSLARALLLKERIKTTEARAKELRPFVETLITKGKEDTLASRRIVISRLGGQGDVADRIFRTIAPRYKERPGGYTRVTKVNTRPGDASPMAVIELV